MICQECGKRPASLHFTKIVNGEKTEFHICESCAREKGESIPGSPGGFSIHSLLSGLLDFGSMGESSQNAGRSAAQAVHCEECGMTYAQFSKIGRFGCSSCYQAFADRLDPLLKRVHSSTSHNGKVPKRTGGQIQCKREIEKLRRDMQDHIQQEEFESAAGLRDRIRKLEKKLAEQ